MAPRVTGDVLVNTVGWFLIPLAVYYGYKSLSAPDPQLERKLASTPDGIRNRERRAKLVEIIKPDEKKDEEFRNLLNKGSR